MRTLAEILFWVGRLQNISVMIVLVHGLVIWHLRHTLWTRSLVATWFLLFVAVSIALWPGMLEYAVNGTGYVEAHLYGGLWRTGDEAMVNILLRWQNVWLPIYVPWLGTWLLGLGGILALSRIEQRLMAKEGQSMTGEIGGMSV